MESARITHRGVGQQQMLSAAGLLARSTEGTAAKGMNIKGNEDLWVEIQANTFRNWLNEHLKDSNIEVKDLCEDLRDGVALCALVSNLQGRKIKADNTQVGTGSPHRKLENVARALRAIEEDGVKLVNIGNEDIVNGNLKLILGLIWSLIVRYQIGKSKFPPRKLMLAWLQAALPECRVANLTTDWNSGVLLSALVDYCQPGLMPHWRNLDSSRKIENCSEAMFNAEKYLQVPRILEPEYLASPWLDEMSGMTYLSYFMKPDSPGAAATLRWINSRLRHSNVRNFTHDWRDGVALTDLVQSVGGLPSDYHLRMDRHPQDRIERALESGERLGVRPLIQSKDLMQKEVEHLSVMSYVTQYRSVRERPYVNDLIQVGMTTTRGRVGEQSKFAIRIVNKEVDESRVRCFIVPPLGAPPVPLTRDRDSPSQHNTYSYTPDKMGIHEIRVEYDGVKLEGNNLIRVLPRKSRSSLPHLPPCPLHSVVEILVSATGAPDPDHLSVIAVSPSGRKIPLNLTYGDETSTAALEPDEAGIWTINVTYRGEHIQESPYTCQVFDPNKIMMDPLDQAYLNKAYAFYIDCTACGVKGDVSIDIVKSNRSVHCAIETVRENLFRVTFVPKHKGRHKVYVYFNGFEAASNPFMIKVKESKEKNQINEILKDNEKEFADTYRKLDSGRKEMSPGYDVTDSLHRSFDNHFTRNLSPHLESPINRSQSPLTSRIQEKSSKYVSEYNRNGSPYLERSLSPNLDQLRIRTDRDDRHLDNFENSNSFQNESYETHENGGYTRKVVKSSHVKKSQNLIEDYGYYAPSVDSEGNSFFSSPESEPIDDLDAAHPRFRPLASRTPATQSAASTRDQQRNIICKKKITKKVHKRHEILTKLY